MGEDEGLADPSRRTCLGLSLKPPGFKVAETLGDPESGALLSEESSKPLCSLEKSESAQKCIKKHRPPPHTQDCILPSERNLQSGTLIPGSMPEDSDSSQAAVCLNTAKRGMRLLLA